MSNVLVEFIVIAFGLYIEYQNVIRNVYNQIMRRIAVSFIFAVAAVMLGFYLARDAWTKVQTEKIQASDTKEQMQLSEKERIDLLKRKNELESQTGREEEARKRGYIRPGEHPL